MSKRIVFCFDGTWNTLSADVPTNVAKLAQMVRPVAAKATPQIVYYDEGIGTNTNWVNRRWQGLTGKGLMGKLREAYRFLIFNYEPEDEIFIFGFSRGAFTARSFAGFIRHAGILDVISANQIDKSIALYRMAPAGKTGKESGQAMRFRLRHCRSVCVSEKDREFRVRVEPDKGHDNVPLLDIRYVGVWDTVSALGIPAYLPLARLINSKYRFHDAVLTSKIKFARHAVALDELRPSFRAMVFDRAKLAELNSLAAVDRSHPFEQWEMPYQERWFPGVHGAVGGGGARRGLSDGALSWVLTGAKRAGLELRNDADAQTFLIHPNSSDNLQNTIARTIWDRGPFGWLKCLFHSPREGPQQLEELALPTLQRWFAPAQSLPDGKAYRPGALQKMAGLIETWEFRDLAELKSEHVVQRGETLSDIAKARLHNPSRYMEIYQANRDRLDDPDHILPGMRLRITGEPDDMDSPLH